MSKKLGWLLGSFLFVCVGIFYYFVIQLWMSTNFSPEVDAATIIAMVTIPLGVTTVLGTTWISIYSNRKTVETAIMQQRTAIRDEIFKKRMEIYKTLFLKMIEPVEKDDFLNWLEVVYKENIFYFSDAVRLIIGTFLTFNNKSPMIYNKEFVDDSINIMKKINKKVFAFFDITMDGKIKANPSLKMHRGDVFREELVVFSRAFLFKRIVFETYPSYLLKFNLFFLNKDKLSSRWYIGFIHEYKDLLTNTKINPSIVFRWLFLGFFDHLMNAIINELDLTTIEEDFKNMLTFSSDYEIRF